MGLKQMFGQRASYCTYCLVECHRFGQVYVAADTLLISSPSVTSLKISSFWSPETQQGIFDAVLKGHIDFDSDPWPLISDSAKDLIRKMLCSRPSERLTAHEVLCMFILFSAELTINKGHFYMNRIDVVSFCTGQYSCLVDVIT